MSGIEESASEQLDSTVEYQPPPGTTVVLHIPKKEGYLSDNE